MHRNPIAGKLLQAVENLLGCADVRMCRCADVEMCGCADVQ